MRSESARPSWLPILPLGVKSVDAWWQEDLARMEISTYNGAAVSNSFKLQADSRTVIAIIHRAPT